MMGCQPQGSSQHPPQTDARYSLAAHSHFEQTLSSGQRLQFPPGQSSPAAAAAPSPAAQHPGPEGLPPHRQFRADLVAPQAFYTPVSADSSSAASQARFQRYPHRDTPVPQQQQQQRFVQPASTVTSSCHQGLSSSSGPRQAFTWPPESAGPQHFGSEPAVQPQAFAHPAQPSPLSQRLAFGPPVRTVVSQYQPPTEPRHLFRPVEAASSQHQQQPQPPPPPSPFRRPAETVTSQHLFAAPPADSARRQPVLGRSLEVSSSSLQSAPSLGQPAADCATTRLTDSPALHFGQPLETVSVPQPTQNPPQQQYRQTVTASPSNQQYYQLSPNSSSSTMLDKKPMLQVVTTDHSPVSPGSSTSSPRFIFPDMHASSSSGHLGSDSGSSPFMSPVKREVKWEVGTPPQSSSELDPAVQQVQRERVRMLSGDTDPSETLVDSETGSSVLEDSSSSREQSPFSAMAESLSLRSPSEHSPSPLARKVFQRQTVMVASEDEEQGEESEGGGGGGGAHGSASGQADGDFHPSKFKKRLHERYVLSLKDSPGFPLKFKEELVDPYESTEGEGQGHSDSKRPVSKIERPDSPQHPESPMPKSPRRSSSDTDNVRTESTEMGASSADEGDVFMEPTMRVRTKHKPPSLHQREPLDLSRGTFYSGYRSSSGSSPLVDTEHISPASKIFSPVFRSPHRLPYSPHGLLSPQSQSPLCSVPEGGRIFNFNMPSPLEGAHSDSDLISPSPMSPRIFTFPPQGSILNPMAEVNRLAVSPRAPYTPPPSMLHSKVLGSAGGGLDVKWGEQHGFYGKRSLSESDMTYLCPVCGQVFPTNDNLAKHMAKHLPTETVRVGDSNKVHYCKVCNRSFSRSDMLTRHMRLHTGLKPYECMECGQVFSRSDHLNTHRRTHTGEKPYRCPHCPYAACRRDMITRHMRTHAKRTSRRTRYLSVPDDGDPHKASGSISSTETTDSQDYSTTSGHTCSVSSVDSVESESIHSTRPSYMGTSVDSLLSPDMLSGGQHSSGSSRKPSEELEEGMEGEGGSQFDRFMRYRKGRNWSTTSLESVDSEEALIREILVDDAFLDPDHHHHHHQHHRPPSGPPGERGSGKDAGQGCQVGPVPAPSPSNPKDAVGVETKTLQKCFISPQPPGGGGGGCGSSSSSSS